MELAKLRHDFRNELNRTGSATDHGDPLIREVVIVIPNCRMPRRSFKGIEPRDIRGGRFAEHTDRTHDKLRLDLFTRIENEAPSRRLLIPPRRFHAYAKS